jgi:hypothetical protein
MVHEIIPMRIMLVYTCQEIMQYYGLLVHDPQASIGFGKSETQTAILLGLLQQLRQPTWAVNPDEYWEW